MNRTHSFKNYNVSSCSEVGVKRTDVRKARVFLFHLMFFVFHLNFVAPEPTIKNSRRFSVNLFTENFLFDDTELS